MLAVGKLSQKRSDLMKIGLLSALMPAVAVGGMTLLLGCEDDSKKSAASGSGDAPAPVVASNAAAVANASPGPLQPAPKAVAAPPVLSPGVDEVVQLAQADVGDEVLMAYVENSPAEYKLKVDEILYLHDLGLSAQVIAAMVRHSQALPEQVATSASAATNGAQKPDAQAAAAAPTTVQPPPTNVITPAETPQVTTAPSEPGPQQVTYNYFYNTLAPYGNWIDLPDYGWCWQPTVSVIN